MSEVNRLALVCLPLGVAIWFWLNRRLYRDGFAPFNVLLFSWAIPLALRTASLSEYEKPWRAPTIAIVGWVTLMLVLPSLTWAAQIRRRGDFEAQRATFEQTLDVLRRRNFLWLLICCYVPAFGAYLYAEFVTNPAGIPLLAVLRGDTLSVLGSELHRWGKDTHWSILSPLLFILTPLCFLAYRANGDRGIRFLFLALALAYPIMGALKLSRSDIFIATLNVVVADHYYRRYRERRAASRLRLWLRYGGVLAVSLTLYYGLMVVRVGGVQVGALYSELIGFRFGGTNPLVQMAAVVYGYAALPFENFHRFFTSYAGDLHVGIGVFRPFLAVSGAGSLADDMDARVPYPDPVSGAAGSATFLTNVYAELGIVGLVAVPVLYALLVNLLYARMRMRPSLGNVLLYLNFLYPWTWLYFNNAFSVLTFYLNAGFIVVLTFVAGSTQGARRLSSRIASAGKEPV